MTCKNCSYAKMTKHNGSPNRYWCLHPSAEAGTGSAMICRCERGSDEITIKGRPRWCPLKKGGDYR